MRSPASSTSPQAPSKPTSPASCESSAPETASRSPCGPTRPAASDAAKAVDELPQPGAVAQLGHVAPGRERGTCRRLKFQSVSVLATLREATKPFASISAVRVVRSCSQGRPEQARRNQPPDPGVGTREAASSPATQDALRRLGEQ